MVDLQLVFSLANVFGTIGTAALGVYGGIKAGERINQIEENSREEKIQIVLSEAIPAITCCIGTVIFAGKARQLQKKEVAKLAALVGIGASQLKDYREEVAREFGPEKEDDIRRRVNARRTMAGIDKEHNLEELSHCFYEPVTDIYFNATTSGILQAINHCNQWMWDAQNPDRLCSMSEFFAHTQNSRVISEKTDRAGWYAGIFEMPFDLPIVGATFEWKEDKLGKEFWIIHWNRGCEPAEDMFKEKRDWEVGNAESFS